MTSHATDDAATGSALAPAAKPLRFGHIFIVTYGRSGSTLLNGVLNSIPGVCLRGENANTLFHLHSAVSAAEIAVGKGGQDSFTHPWQGSGQIDVPDYRRRLIDDFVQCVLRPPQGALAVGFKEVRYDIAAMTEAQYDAYIGFLLSAFDRACIIFNVRGWQDVAESEWWLSNPFARRFIRNCNARFDRSMRLHPSATIKVKYDRHRDNPEALRPLFDFLGAQFDREAIERVLATPHSYRSPPEKLQMLRQSRSVLLAELDSLARRLRRKLSV